MDVVSEALLARCGTLRIVQSRLPGMFPSGKNKGFAMPKHQLTGRTVGLLAVAGLLAGLAFPAAAQAPQTINPEQACKDDAFKFCNDFIPDRDKVGACLRKNARRLTRDCRTIVLGGTGTHKHRTYHHHTTH